MKKFITLIGLLVPSLVFGQATYSETFTLANNTTVTNLLNFSAKITKIIVSVGAGNAATYNYAFLDAPYRTLLSNLYVTNPRVYFVDDYTGIVSYITNLPVTVTNYEGVATNLYRSNVLYSLKTVVAESTGTFNTRVAGNATAVGTITLDYSTGPLYVGFGLSFTNTGTGSNNTITVFYDPSL